MVLRADDIPLFIEHLMRSSTVIAPVAKGEALVFSRIERPADAVLDYTATILPPKKFLLPQEEEHVRFSRKIHIARSEEAPFDPTVLLGVHPCDMQGILRLDFAFSKHHPESNYLRRRETMAIIGVSCRPDEHCFCQLLGTYNTRQGFDLFLTRLPDKLRVTAIDETRKRMAKESRAYLLDVLTERGAELLKDFDLFTSATLEDLDEAQKVHDENARPRRTLGCHVGALPELFRLSKNDALWSELADRCLACGSCNLVCPTCYCFDVADRLILNLNDGGRSRHWDSRLPKSFAFVGTEESFQENREDRIRHEFRCRFSLLGEKIRGTVCVGCGRCARACPAKIDPVEVLSQLSKKHELSLLPRVFSIWP
jgi:ferredoxin